MFALIMGVVSVNAQIATQNSNAFDNVSVGVTAGVSTPLDFNSVFPLNTNVGVKLQKDFTTVFGVQVEGIAVLNDNHFNNIKTAVKATNVGANGVFNLSNIFAGYNGTPRFFEVSTVTGIGWLYSWNTSDNFLSAKTGLDLAFNVGSKKAVSIVLTPAIYWNLNRPGDIHFDKNNAQLAVNASLIYRFKTSNGTHNFKTYDVGAMLNEISYLKGRLDECESREPKVVEKIVKVEIPVDKDTVKVGNDTWVVAFNTGSSWLTNEGQFILNQIDKGTVVNITATASPDGTNEFNQRLSESRAARVKDYLVNRGIKVNNSEGKGVNSETGKTAVVKAVK